MRRKQQEAIPHPRYDRSQPLLRDLVLTGVHVLGTRELFDVLLTRVPAIGEDLTREGRVYRVTEVEHQPLDDDGRAQLGWHALVAVVPVPDPPRPRRKK